MKKVYVEIGNACFCKCVCCDIHDRPHKIMEIENFKSTVRNLKSMGFEQVRLAGNDPLTNKDFCKYVDIVYDEGLQCEVTTTLLTKKRTKVAALGIVDDLNISLSAVGSDYEKFFNVKKWDLFVINFCELMGIRGGNKITTINYTITRETLDQDVFRRFILFMGSYVSNRLEVNIFPAIYYDRPFTEEEKKKILQIYGGIEHGFNLIYDFSEYEMHSCTIPKAELYVQVNGDVYPCCLSGGELGQSLESELLIGNILRGDQTVLFERTQKPMTGLNNQICNRCSQKYVKKMKRIATDSLT